MITEFAIAGAGLYLFNRYKNKDIIEINKSLNNIFDKSNLEYTILDTNRSEFGYTIIISLCGSGFTKLENLKEQIETLIGYNVFINQNENIKTATLNIIIKKLTDTTKFEPITTKPSEFYAGLNFKFEHLKSNLQSYPHVLVSGQTGSGKTEIIRLALTNLIYNFDDEDINIYFSDLSDMCDFEIFKKCRQVKGYAKNIKESYKLFEYLMHIYNKRLSLFNSRGCKNIKEYNKAFKNKKMTYVYLVLDEFADYFPTNKFETGYELKIKCYNLLKHMVRKFRKVGIFLIVGIQRPDTTVLDPSLRSGLCTKVGFSQNTNSSSLVVCDTNELTNIENRKGLFMYGNTRECFKSLYIDDKLIKKYIKDSIVDYNKNFNKFLRDNETNTPPVNIKKSNTVIPKLKSKVKIS